MEDYDIVCEIGSAQETGLPLGPTQVIQDRLGATATLRRRLTRLVKLGIVTITPDQNDERRVLLGLSHEAFKAYAKLERLIRQ